MNGANVGEANLIQKGGSSVMMKKSRRSEKGWLALLLGMVFLVWLAGCGEKGGKKDDGSGSKEDSSAHYELELVEGEIRGEITKFHFCKGVLYIAEQENGISRIYRHGNGNKAEVGAEGKSESGTEDGSDSEKGSDEAVLELQKGEKLLDFATLSDGRIVAAVLLQQGKDTDDMRENSSDEQVPFSLRIYDVSGKLQKEVVVPEMEGSSAFARLRVTRDDKIVLALNNSACELREDGTVIWLNQGLDFLIMGVYALEEGEVILTSLTEQGTMLNMVSGEGLVSRQVGMVPNYVQIVDSGTGLYAAGNGCLYKVEENGNRIEVLSLAAQGITSTTVEAVFKEGDSYGICLYDRNVGNAFQVAILQEKEGAVEKTVLTIATTDEFIARGAMGAFNMRSKTHRVTSKNYTDDIQMRNAQIDASMLSEDAPDLVCMMGQERYENYAQKGALLDVTELIPREDYLERTLEDFTVDGKIYGMPMYFTVQTLWCVTEDIKGKASWNVSEFLEFMEEYPNALMEPTATKETGKMIILRFALQRGIYEFIDFENGVASFDSEAFRGLLQRIDGLKITAVTETKLQRSMQGETILWCDSLSEMSSLPYIAAKAGQGREFTLIGFPDGKHGSGGIVSYSAALGVNAKTKEPEAAKEFFGDWLHSGGAWSKYTFPIAKRGFEEVIERGKEAVYKKDEEGNPVLDEEGNPVEEGAYWRYTTDNGEEVSFVVYAMTDQQEEMLRKAVDGSIGRSRGEQTILNIIQEEAQMYFAGQIGLDETVDKIQSRVQLFLEERK